MAAKILRGFGYLNEISHDIRQAPVALHGMALLTAALFIFSWTSAAKPRCFQLLENHSPEASRPADAQREIVKSLQLAQISTPNSDSNVHYLQSSMKIEELSRINLERMSQKVRDRFSVNNESQYGRQVDEALEDIEFVAFRRLNNEQDITGFKPEKDFYNNLTGSTRSVGLRWKPIVKHAVHGRTSDQFHADVALVNRKFVAQHGYVLPEFSLASELINFFAQWDPQILEQMIRFNRMNLPIGMRTVAEFLAYIKHHDQGLNLEPLRTQLHRYLLTDSDAEKLSRLALKLQILKDVEGGETLDKELKRLKARPERAFSEALEHIGWEKMEVRIPLTVTPHFITIVRHREVMQQQQQLRPMNHFRGGWRPPPEIP